MKTYRIVKEYLENTNVRYAVEYQNSSTFEWLLVTHRDSFSEAEQVIITLQGQEVIGRKVLGVYSD